MSKESGEKKKARARNLTGLSVFEDEINAPTEYGDFMRVDAPVLLRASVSTPRSDNSSALIEHSGLSGVNVTSEPQARSKEQVASPTAVVSETSKPLQILKDGFSAPIRTNEQISGSEASRTSVSPDSHTSQESTTSRAEKIQSQISGATTSASGLADFSSALNASILESANESTPSLSTHKSEPAASDDNTGPTLDPLSKLATDENSKRPIKNLSQSEAKLKPNISQSRAKPEPHLSQSEAKVEPYNSVPLNASDKLEPQPEPIHKPKLSQSAAKVEPNLHPESLVGLQRNALTYIFESCVRTGSRVTPPIAISNMAVALETTISAGRKALQRLEEKAFVSRHSYKDGRGGWTKYQLHEEVYKSLLLETRSPKLEPNISQSRAKVGTQPEPQPEPTLSSSSSDLYLNDSTTKTSDQIVADNKWAAVRIERLAHINFTKTHLKQIRDRGLCSPEELDQSIEHFAFDLEKNGKSKEIKTNELGFFMGIMNSKNFYAAPQNFVSEIDLVIRARTEAARKRAQALAEAEFAELSVQIAEWIQALSAQQKLELLGNDGFLNELSPSIQRVKLQHVYLEKHGLVQEFDRLQRLTSSNV